MDELARRALNTLLAASDRAAAGVRTRAPALTESHLSEYRDLRSLQAKESFEATLKDARAQGAVTLHWDDYMPNGFIKRVDLLDIVKLADFLGQVTAASVVAGAELRLQPYLTRFPVLSDVLHAWQKLRKVRGLDASEATSWIDAVTVVDFARANTEAERVDLPLRVASARLFNDSKRIERLYAPIDVLLQSAIDAAPREAPEVWGELGLFREEQPARLAGRIVVRRERLTSFLDIPYSGFSPATILGLDSQPSAVLSIPPHARTSPPWMYSRLATIADAPPPRPLKSATICGIAVIWMRMPLTMPMTEPTAMAATVTTRPVAP